MSIDIDTFLIRKNNAVVHYGDFVLAVFLIVAFVEAQGQAESLWLNSALQRIAS